MHCRKFVRMCGKTVNNTSDTLTTNLAENIPISPDSMPKDINGLLPDTKFQPMDKLNLNDMLDQSIPINALVLGVSFAILIRVIFIF